MDDPRIMDDDGAALKIWHVGVAAHKVGASMGFADFW
jgi:hypothetical protein